jgi:RHS repeat-associated protein
VPARSDTVLVTSEVYDAAGYVQTVTDPAGLITQSYHDNLGRVTKTIEDYTDGNPTSNSNKTTEVTYDGDGNTLTVKVDLPGGASETTQFVYGATTAAGDAVNSNDQLVATRYPDPSTGNPSTSQQESYTLDALGERRTLSDRNGSVHTFSYDALGELTTDAVTTLANGVDGAVRRLQVAYNVLGQAYQFTTYNAASGGSIVNQAQDVFNGLGQLTTEYQSHSGAVNTSTTPKVQYAYVEMAGGANNSRLTSETYPSGRVLNFNYNAGVDSSISRLSSISDSSATLESYAYLGADTVVKRIHPQSVDLTYVGTGTGDGGDQYVGLDRFGRVVDQKWVVSGTATVTDEFKYGYDRDSNRLYRDNLVNSAFGELYTYDGENQLTSMQRGTLNGTHTGLVGSASFSQSFTTDALGNFSNVTTNGTGQSRTNNLLNQLTAVGASSLAYDQNGNLTTDQNGNTLKYDAWNHLVLVTSGATTLDAYGYDALGQRITENPGTQRDLYYSDSWQVLEEDVGGSAVDQNVWSPVYVDALVERDSGSGLSVRLYAQQDANWDVTALVDTTGTVQERYDYTPYGAQSVLTPSWGSRSSSSYAFVYGHQGERMEFSTGLNYSRARDFSPALQRWIERDPEELWAGDSNIYRTESNNPTDASDPSGLEERKSNLKELVPLTKEQAAYIEGYRQYEAPIPFPRVGPSPTLSPNERAEWEEGFRDAVRGLTPREAWGRGMGQGENRTSSVTEEVLPLNPDRESLLRSGLITKVFTPPEKADPLPADSVVRGVVGGFYSVWAGIPERTLIGFRGCGPCTGVILIPRKTDLGKKPYYVFHFSAKDSPLLSILTVLKKYDQQNLDGYMALTGGAQGGKGHAAKTYYHTIKALRNLGVKHILHVRTGDLLINRPGKMHDATPPGVSKKGF